MTGQTYTVTHGLGDECQTIAVTVQSIGGAGVWTVTWNGIPRTISARTRRAAVKRWAEKAGMQFVEVSGPVVPARGVR